MLNIFYANVGSLWTKIKPWDNLSLESKNFDFKIKLSHGLIWFNCDNFVRYYWETFPFGITCDKKIFSNIISGYLILIYNGNQG